MLALLYHRIGTGKHANSLAMLKSHFEHIARHYHSVLPGDPLSSGAVCLTFDDATYDFYHYVFPLIKQLNLRVLLGVPVRYILETTPVSAEERLKVPYPLMMQDGIFESKAPFCSWKELREMVQSGHVEVASHSFSHANLTFPFVKLEREVILSKQILEEKLSQSISSFIYPFGRYTSEVHLFVLKHYAYAFRIGSAINSNWKNPKVPLSRIPADCLKSPAGIFTFSKMLKYRLKNLIK